MTDQVNETTAQAATVARILERCEQELARLERIPTKDADDVNALSMALGFTKRARAALARFQ